MCTATPTDTTNAPPLGTVRPHAHNPTEGPSPQAPATPSASAPGFHLPTQAQAEPASQGHHNPRAGPAVRPTETPSRSGPSPQPGHDPNPDPTRTTVPADTPWSAYLGGQPGPTPVPEGHTREAAQPAGGAATPPAPPAQTQGEEPTVDSTPEMGGLRSGQRRTYPPWEHPKRKYLTGGRTSRKTGVPARRTWRQAEATKHRTLANLVRDLTNQCRMPSMPPASPHQPSTGHNLRVARTLPPFRGPSASQRCGRAGECRARGGATTGPTWSQCADDRETSPSGHNRDEDLFAAFMESSRSNPHADPAPAAPRGRPDPGGDHTEGTPLTVSRQAHLQRDYTALGMETEHATATDDRPATPSCAADQALDERSTPESGTRVEAGTNTASQPTSQPPGTSLSLGRQHLDYARSEGDPRHPSARAEQAAARDLGLWIDRLTTEEQLAQAVSIRWLRTSRCCHLKEGTRTLADITFGHRTEHTPLATMDQPGQWHYVATRLMAHMGAYSPDELNGLHWQWH